MPTWSGWQAQFLNRANIIVTPPNIDLLTQWAKHTTTAATRNPIDLSANVSGSTSDGDLPGIFPKARNYPTHAAAARAFGKEVSMSFANELQNALNTGNPYQVSYFNDVASVFISWGSDKYADVYLAAAQGQKGSTGGGLSTKAPHTHSGYHDLQHTWQHNLPTALRQSLKLSNAALRSLGHAHKVKG